MLKFCPTLDFLFLWVVVPGGVGGGAAAGFMTCMNVTFWKHSPAFRIYGEGICSLRRERSVSGADFQQRGSVHRAGGLGTPSRQGRAASAKIL